MLFALKGKITSVYVYGMYVCMYGFPAQGFSLLLPILHTEGSMASSDGGINGIEGSIMEILAGAMRRCCVGHVWIVV